jgi:hypothetical protein
VKALKVDLLCVGARGVGGVERLVLGSVAEGALDRSPVAVCSFADGSRLACHLPAGEAVPQMPRSRLMARRSPTFEVLVSNAFLRGTSVAC